MKKYVLKQSGKEVKVGDTLVNQGTITTPLGRAHVVQEILVTKDNIPELLKEGIITLAPLSNCTCNECLPEEKMQISYYVNKIAERFNCIPSKIRKLLETLNYIYPAASFSVVLREIAIELDKKYDDHIQNSPKIYVVSSLDGRITEANKAHIKNYKNFAAFRSIEDARIACKITKKLLKNMYKSGK